MKQLDTESEVHINRIDKVYLFMEKWAAPLALALIFLLQYTTFLLIGFKLNTKELWLTAAYIPGFLVFAYCIMGFAVFTLLSLLQVQFEKSFYYVECFIITISFFSIVIPAWFFFLGFIAMLGYGPAV